MNRIPKGESLMKITKTSQRPSNKELIKRLVGNSYNYILIFFLLLEAVLDGYQVLVSNLTDASMFLSLSFLDIAWPINTAWPT